MRAISRAPPAAYASNLPRFTGFRITSESLCDFTNFSGLLRRDLISAFAQNQPTAGLHKFSGYETPETSQFHSAETVRHHAAKIFRTTKAGFFGIAGRAKKIPQACLRDFFCVFGDDEVRTHDLHNAIVALFQLSYVPLTKVLKHAYLPPRVKDFVEKI